MPSPGVITGIGEALTGDGDVVDFVVRGEGELTTPELMACLASGGDPSTVAGIAFVKDGAVHATAARPFVHDLDSLVPAWDLVDFSLYKFFPIPDTKLAIMSRTRTTMTSSSRSSSAGTTRTTTSWHPS
jgi:anaerobic magnesium-protoporphyrin IX monomethyl ester cyclase